LEKQTKLLSVNEIFVFVGCFVFLICFVLHVVGSVRVESPTQLNENVEVSQFLFFVVWCLERLCGFTWLVIGMVDLVFVWNGHRTDASEKVSGCSIPRYVYFQASYVYLLGVFVFYVLWYCDVFVFYVLGCCGVLRFCGLWCFGFPGFIFLIATTFAINLS
jgi:hypothetical protein